MLSVFWSRATVTSHQVYSPLPLPSLGFRILLLLLCGRALSIPVECPSGSAQCPLDSVSGDGLDAKVLILGAGVAGITAAQKLESHGISDFLIVEAHHEVGGRLKSRQFGSHDSIRTSRTNDTLKSIEVGAQWIQGYHEHNPIWRLAKKHGIKTRLSDFSESVSESLLVPSGHLLVERRVLSIGYDRTTARTWQTLTFEAYLCFPLNSDVRQDGDGRFHTKDPRRLWRLHQAYHWRW